MKKSFGLLRIELMNMIRNVLDVVQGTGNPGKDYAKGTQIYY